MKRARKKRASLTAAHVEQLANRLLDFALGTHPMRQEQVEVALRLLDKCLPPVAARTRKRPLGRSSKKRGRAK